MDEDPIHRSDWQLATADLQWLVELPHFDSMPEGPRKALFAMAKPMRASKGHRIIAQGDEGTELYIIRTGKCLVSVESRGITHVIGRLSSGQLVGEMAVLTGETRSAHVDAETDVELWTIDRDTFNQACDQFPPLRWFLTRLVSDRLSTALFATDRTIGKYVVERIIGEGGYSVVYKGYHVGLTLPVAVKMLKHHKAMDSAFVERFRNEAKIIAQLNHRNIVKVYDIEELYKTFFIIMELVDGSTLTRVLKEAVDLSVPTVVQTLLQVCAGLTHAHARGVIHGDIKPGNILMEEDGTVRIVDFGFARPPGMYEHAGGTPHYMAPEQIVGGPVDERSDLYSVGIMAYEMLTGRRPCPASDCDEILQWHLQDHVNDPRTVVPKLREDLSTFVIRATRKDPDMRFRTVWHALRHLEAVADALGPAVCSLPQEELDMTGLFVFYRRSQRAVLEKMVREFGRELKKVGVRLRGTSLSDVEH